MRSRLTGFRSGTPCISRFHPGGHPGANLESISHRCYLFEIAFEWELTEETIVLPLGCLQDGLGLCSLAGSLCNSAGRRSCFSSYTKVYSVIYDFGSVPEKTSSLLVKPRKNIMANQPTLSLSPSEADLNKKHL